MRARMFLTVSVLSFAASAGGCGGREKRWPFPDADSRDDAAILATLAERTSGIETLYAELTMSFETKERSAVLGAAVNYRAPDAIRMSAFKDILISSRNVFDFLLTRGGFVAVIEGEEGPERREGSLAELEAIHPGFRAMGSLREAMFLPGRVPPGAPARIERAPGRIVLHTSTPSGDRVAWDLDPRTLGVLGGQVFLGGAGPPALVRYESYRPAGKAFVPEMFRLEDPGAGVVLEGWLEDLELNPDLEPWIFDPASVAP